MDHTIRAFLEAIKKFKHALASLAIGLIISKFVKAVAITKNEI